MKKEILLMQHYQCDYIFCIVAGEKNPKGKNKMILSIVSIGPLIIPDPMSSFRTS